MSAIALEALEKQLVEVVRQVRERNETVDVTDGGVVVARLTPVTPLADSETMRRIWEERDRIASEIGKYWPAGVRAAAAIAEDRE